MCATHNKSIMFKYIHFTHRTGPMFQQPRINTHSVKFMSEKNEKQGLIKVLQFHLQVFTLSKLNYSLHASKHLCLFTPTFCDTVTIKQNMK